MKIHMLWPLHSERDFIIKKNTPNLQEERGRSYFYAQNLPEAPDTEPTRSARQVKVSIQFIIID